MNPAQADDIGWRGNNQGDQMKSTLLWSNDGNGTNTSNFTGYPGGLRSSITEGEFQNMGDLGNWWTSTESVGDYVVYRYLHYDSPGVGRHNNSKSVCLSVRCVKD